MIKLVYTIYKRADISEAEFHRYWLEEHGPRVKSHADAMGADRYVQSHNLRLPLNEALAAPRGMPAAHDGITELWWSDRERLEASLASEAGQEMGRDLLEDERHFIDFERSTIFLAEEHEIFSK